MVSRAKSFLQLLELAVLPGKLYGLKNNSAEVFNDFVACLKINKK